MKIPEWLPVYGSMDYRGECPKEALEQVTLFARIRRTWPESLGRIALHPRNEGRKDGRQVVREKAEGMTPGAADIVIPGAPTLVMELKRRDHTQSSWQDGQLDYLLAAKEQGAWVCVALGADAGMEAINGWLETQKRHALGV